MSLNRQKAIRSYYNSHDNRGFQLEPKSLNHYFQDFKVFLYEPLLANHSHQDIFYLGLLLMPIWFLGNILYNYSLLMTSISSSTVIR